MFGPLEFLSTKNPSFHSRSGPSQCLRGLLRHGDISNNFCRLGLAPFLRRRYVLTFTLDLEKPET